MQGQTTNLLTHEQETNRKLQKVQIQISCVMKKNRIHYDGGKSDWGSLFFPSVCGVHDRMRSIKRSYITVGLSRLVVGMLLNFAPLHHLLFFSGARLKIYSPKGLNALLNQLTQCAVHYPSLSYDHQLLWHHVQQSVSGTVTLMWRAKGHYKPLNIDYTANLSFTQLRC